jgi:hypothetical protein
LKNSGKNARGTAGGNYHANFKNHLFHAYIYADCFFYFSEHRCYADYFSFLVCLHVRMPYSDDNFFLGVYSREAARAAESAPKAGERSRLRGTSTLKNPSWKRRT